MDNLMAMYYCNGEYLSEDDIKFEGEKRRDYERETSYEGYIESLEIENDYDYDLDNES